MADVPPTLSLHAPHRHAPADRLRAMLETVTDHELPDEYGRGGRVAALEVRVADLLGKDAAVFLPTGGMASQVALCLHADARSTRTVGFHPRSTKGSAAWAVPCSPAPPTWSGRPATGAPALVGSSTTPGRWR